MELRMEEWILKKNYQNKMAGEMIELVPNFFNLYNYLIVR